MLVGPGKEGDKSLLWKSMQTRSKVRSLGEATSGRKVIGEFSEAEKITEKRYGQIRDCSLPPVMQANSTSCPLLSHRFPLCLLALFSFCIGTR